MKKMLLGAVGLSAVLASCGSGVAPDLSGSGSVTAVRTEYRTESGQFVACDNYDNATATTQVSVYFNVSGNVQSVDVALRGNTTNRYDGNYRATFTGEQLASVGNGSYRVTFNANPTTGGLLPQAIVVNPARAKVKVVAVSGRAGTAPTYGSFRSDLSVNTGSATFKFSSRPIPSGNVDIYTTCTLIRTTDEDV